MQMDFFGLCALYNIVVFFLTILIAIDSLIYKLIYSGNINIQPIELHNFFFFILHLYSTTKEHTKSQLYHVDSSIDFNNRFVFNNENMYIFYFRSCVKAWREVLRKSHSHGSP